MKIKTAAISVLFFIFIVPGIVRAASPLDAVLAKGRAVVSIEAIDAAVYKDKPQGVIDPATGRMLVIQKMRRVAAVETGGGIILRRDGIIVTAAHTLQGKKNFSVVLFNGLKLPAEILKKVPSQDIAFLKVNPPFPLETIELANSDTIRVGSNVYAMGRAQWIHGTLTGGEVSGLGIEEVEGVKRATSLRIEFKAYKGDSGSPVLDGKGRLAGMISAGKKYGKTTYAIASNVIWKYSREYFSE